MPENLMTFKEALTAYWKRAKEQSQALPTGLPRLDEFLKGGLFPGETILVAERPHMGKTSLLLNITDNLLKVR